MSPQLAHLAGNGQVRRLRRGTGHWI